MPNNIDAFATAQLTEARQQTAKHNNELNKLRQQLQQSPQLTTAQLPEIIAAAIHQQRPLPLIPDMVGGDPFLGPPPPRGPEKPPACSSRSGGSAASATVN